MEQRKILMIIPNLDFGGAQRVFRNLSVNLAKKYPTTECVFNFEHGHAYVSGTKIISLDVSSGKNLFDKIYKFFVRCIRYGRLKKNERATVSISHLEGANYVNLLSAGECRNIIVEHGSKLPYDENRVGFTGWVIKNILVPRLYRRADTIVVVSKGLKLELSEYFGLNPGKIVVINNSFDLDEIKNQASEPVPEEFEWIFRKKVIITSGRLVEEKNYRKLIDVFSEVVKLQDSRLVFIGDGPLQSALREYALKRNLKVSIAVRGVNTHDADVYFLGYQHNPFKFLARASAFVLPSEREGFPLALCEAMICGLPVIASDCRTGPREILAPETTDQYELLTSAEHAPFGILVPVPSDEHTIACWADELTKLLNNEDLQEKYKKSGRNRMQDFSHASIMNKWFSLID